MPSAIRTTLSAVVSAGLLALAVGTASLAAAQPAEQDNMFIAELRATGIPMLPRDEAIHFAHSVCDALAAGHADPNGVAAATSDSTALTMEEAKDFVYGAVMAYCAQYMDMLD